MKIKEKSLFRNGEKVVASYKILSKVSLSDLFSREEKPHEIIIKLSQKGECGLKF